MLKHVLVTMCVVLGGASLAFAQAADGPFQVRFATNLKKKDVINLSNSGASSTIAIPQNGALCANLYAFSAGGPMIGCCSCRVPPNSLEAVPVVADVLADAKQFPKNVVLKAMASKGGPSGCSGVNVGTGSDVLMTGMLAWKGDNPFVPSTLSAAELNSLNTQCALLHGSGNACASCPPTPGP